MRLLPIGLISSAALAAGFGDHPDLQAALDAQPGRVITLPAGDYRISRKLVLRGDGAGLVGPGRIIQENPDEPILEIDGLKDVTLRELTLTRAPGKTVSRKSGLLALRCAYLVVDRIRVIDNQSATGALALRECRFARVTGCLVRNYMRVSVDDRTHSPDWGYAFNCTDGTGIQVSASQGTLIEGNTIVEETLRPTRETMEKHALGVWTKKNPEKGRFLSQAAWDAGRTDNWQQGSGIVVTSPESSELTRIIGNHVENGAQGIDLHCDRVTVAHNVVANCFIGMKAMHGSRNVLITGNQFVRNSLWAIGLMPGAAAHKDNPDGGSIVSDNVISLFGQGDASWIWGEGNSPFKFDTGQQADDPPLTDVLVRGNLIDQAGPPRYKYAVIISGPVDGPSTPRGLHFQGNGFAPGSAGVSNRPLAE
ncbi:MAG: nitrous oxide reductase family maturation protein NosD [Opitutia bacterium]